MDYLTPLESDSHPLLEAKHPSYTHATVRRAFIVWLRCGQKNQFRDVCNYYHHLENMENSLSADSRASSRHHEFSLFVSEPPTSPFQQTLFPQLYSSPIDNNMHSPSYIQNCQKAFAVNGMSMEELAEVGRIKAEKIEITNQDIFNASQVFKVNKDVKSKGIEAKFEAMKVMHGNIKEKLNKNDQECTGTSKQDILETSEMIKNYCKEQQVPLKNFLENFKEYASRCHLNNTVSNVGIYIKRKMIQAELPLGVKVHKAKSFKEVVVPKSSFTKLIPLVKNDDLNTQEIKLTLELAKLTEFDSKSDEDTTKPNTDEVVSNFDDLGENLTDKCITLLRRDTNETKPANGFSSVHLLKLDSQKCRKI